MRLKSWFRLWFCLESQSTPTVGETDWRYNGGVTRNGNESDMNIIQSNSVSYVSNSGGGGGVHGGNSGALHKDQTPVSSTTYIRSSTNLQRHLSCPRPYLANSNGSQVYFNSRPSSQMMQVHYEGSLSRPQHQQQHPLRNHLRRQHSDRYQYHRDPVEVDSMGFVCLNIFARLRQMVNMWSNVARSILHSLIYSCALRKPTVFLVCCAKDHDHGLFISKPEHLRSCLHFYHGKTSVI